MESPQKGREHKYQRHYCPKRLDAAAPAEQFRNCLIPHQIPCTNRMAKHIVPLPTSNSRRVCDTRSVGLSWGEQSWVLCRERFPARPLSKGQYFRGADGRAGKTLRWLVQRRRHSTINACRKLISVLCRLRGCYRARNIARIPSGHAVPTPAHRLLDRLGSPLKGRYSRDLKLQLVRQRLAVDLHCCTGHRENAKKEYERNTCADPIISICVELLHTYSVPYSSETFRYHAPTKQLHLPSAAATACSAT